MVEIGSPPPKSPVVSETRSLNYVRFSGPIMLWGQAFQYAALGEDQGMYGFPARTIEKRGDEIILNGTMVFPVSGGGIACYVYAE